jgi:hypothetical protein
MATLAALASASPRVVNSHCVAAVDRKAWCRKENVGDSHGVGQGHCSVFRQNARSRVLERAGCHV